MSRRPERWIACLSCVLALAAGRLAAQEPTNAAASDPAKEELDPLRMSVRVGFADRSRLIRVNRWHPVFVELENRFKKKQDGVKGFLRVTHKAPVSRVDDTSSYTPVDLPAGSKKLVVLHEFVEEDDQELLVELVQGRDVRISDGVQIADLARSGDGADLYLEVSPRPHGLAWLETRSRGELKEQELPLRMLLPTDPLELPRAWIGWDALDGILIDDPETLPLEDAQVTALQTFVRLGGTLVVAAGKNSPVIAASALAPILPAELGEPLLWSATGQSGAPELDLTKALTDWTGREAKVPSPIPGAQLERSRGKLLAGTEVAPLAIEERIGLGKIVVLALSASDPALARDEAAHECVRRCLGRSTPRLLREPFRNTEGIEQPLVQPPYVFPGSTAGQPASLVRRGQAWVPQGEDLGEGGWRDYLEEAFVNDLLTRIPSWNSVCGFLAAYFLVLVPLNYLVFRRLHRLEYAWPAAVAIALAFSAAAYTVGLRGGATTLSIRHLSLVEAGSGSVEGRATHLLGLASAAHLEGDFRFAGEDRYVTRLRTRKDRRGHERENITAQLDEQGVELRNFRVLARAIAGMELVRLYPLGQGIQLRVERGSGRWHVSVKNGSDQDLTSAVLLLGDHACAVGNIAKGATWEQPLADADLAARETVLKSWSHESKLHETFGGSSRDVLEAFATNEAHGPLTVALLALLADPGVAVTYDGVAVPAHGATVLALRPELTLAAGPFDLPPDLWRLRVVKCDFQGADLEASGLAALLRSPQSQLLLEPAVWEPAAQIDSGRLKFSIGDRNPSNGTSQFHLLPWKPGGQAGTVQNMSQAGAESLDYPLAPAQIDPATGAIRLEFADDTNVRVGPFAVTLKGRRP